MRKGALLFVLLFFISFTVHAQDDWEIVVVERENASGVVFLTTLTANGITGRDALPAAEALTPGIHWLTQATLSDDGRYLAAYLPSQLNDDTWAFVVYNLDAGTCCLYIENPTGRELWTPDLGGFDGSRLAFGYFAIDDVPGTPIDAGIVILDAASGDILSQMPVEELNQALGSPVDGEYIFPFVDAWTDEGILFHIQCADCPPRRDPGWIFSIWNPDTGEFQAGAGEGYSLSGSDVLESTGELLYLNNSPFFPDAGSTAFPPAPNVVEYYPEGSPPGRSHSLSNTVFFSEDDVELNGEVGWVLNGEAFVVANKERPYWYLVFRDGDYRRVEMPQGARLIAGTPEGWLVASDNGAGSAVTHYKVDDEGVPQANNLGSLGESYVVLRTPDLNPDDRSPFPKAQPRTVAEVTPTVASCASSRVAATGQGRVLPGNPLTLYAAPSASSPQMGVLNPGDTFSVVAGPFCDGATQWWVISTDTLPAVALKESEGDVYFVEPVS